MINIWQSLPKPFFILAPMEDVTDTVFRRIVLSTGAPDLFFTEFTNCEGLLSVGRKRVGHRLQFTPEEKPLIAQIWGTKPEQFYEVAKELSQMGFDGIDLNMGCPEKSVLKIGACSALITNHSLAGEIIDATKRGAGALPVSVKTRIGYKTIQTEDWISFLLEQDIAALSVHGRTASELSLVPAHWDEIGKAVEIRDTLKKETLIIGNGDIMSYQEGLEKAEKYHLDGIMIGRGVFHNPWFFDKTIDSTSKTRQDRLELLIKHVKLFDQTWGKMKNYHILKKYFKIYVQGFQNASDLRVKLMETNTPEESIAIAEEAIHSS